MQLYNALPGDPPGPVEAIYTAVYSGISVYEMISRNVAVMRRKGDSYLNATQILKVAGIDKGRRTKILEKEVQIGEHEKVQGGYGKYQGTWIPFDKGVEVARAYNVEHLLRPLLEYVPPADEADETPKKKARARPKPPADPYQQSNLSQSRAYTNNGQNNGNNQFANSAPANKKARNEYYEPHQAPNQPLYYAQAPVVPQPQPVAYKQGERYRSTLMSMFLHEDGNSVPEILTSPEAPADLDIDLIIDDQGHTSLHWASALAKIPILQHLLRRSADTKGLNFNGESALVRAVLVTNNFDHDTFPEVLQCLWQAIPCQDKKSRTVFHHIALTAGVKGRVQASRYYLEVLISFLNSPPSNILTMLEGQAEIPGPAMMENLINLQDKNGDTALNIATRIGNRQIVESLEKAGADKTIPNKAGQLPVMPTDEGTSPKDSDDDAMDFNAPLPESKEALEALLHETEACLNNVHKNSYKITKRVESIKNALEKPPSDITLPQAASELLSLLDQQNVNVPEDLRSVIVTGLTNTSNSPKQEAIESDAMKLIAKACELPVENVGGMVGDLLRQVSGDQMSDNSSD